MGPYLLLYVKTYVEDCGTSPAAYILACESRISRQRFTVMKWPSKSPDLSWIENLWGYVAVKLSKRNDLTRENFLQACQDRGVEQHP